MAPSCCCCVLQRGSPLVRVSCPPSHLRVKRRPRGAVPPNVSESSNNQRFWLAQSALQSDTGCTLPSPAGLVCDWRGSVAKQNVPGGPGAAGNACGHLAAVAGAAQVCSPKTWRPTKGPRPSNLLPYVGYMASKTYIRPAHSPERGGGMPRRRTGGGQPSLIRKSLSPRLANKSSCTPMASRLKPPSTTIMPTSLTFLPLSGLEVSSRTVTLTRHCLCCEACSMGPRTRQKRCLAASRPGCGIDSRQGEPKPGSGAAL